MEDEPEETVTADGAHEWYLGTRRHRADGPAVIRPDGTREWWVMGWRHRDDGPAIVYPDGSASWWFRGHRHRLDCPAVTFVDGYEEWWVDDELHRTDGPAVFYGERRIASPRPGVTPGQWWLHGVRYDVRNAADETAFLLGLFDRKYDIDPE